MNLRDRVEKSLQKHARGSHDQSSHGGKKGGGREKHKFPTRRESAFGPVMRVLGEDFVVDLGKRRSVEDMVPDSIVYWGNRRMVINNDLLGKVPHAYAHADAKTWASWIQSGGFKYFKPIN